MKNHNHKVYGLYTLRELCIDTLNGPQEEYRKGKWRPARPIRYYSKLNDLKLAYLVFTRKADAFIWKDNRD